MAVGKEILTKIRSVQSTQKITRAMEMVSTSKMRRTQDQMRQARPYAEYVRVVMGHLASTQEKNLAILSKHERVRRAAIVLITPDKGLCGGMNANVLKRFYHLVRDYQDQGVDVEVVCLGSKGLAACRRIGVNVVASAVNLGDKPKLEALLGGATLAVNAYVEGRIDAVHLVYTRFVNTMKQEPVAEILLPIGEDVLQPSSEISHGWDYLYEPDPLTVLEYLVRRYLESVVYQAVCENMASEQAARMVAMKAATDNASGLIRNLRLVYNKSRQAAITTELTEIVAGAAAV